MTGKIIGRGLADKRQKRRWQGSFYDYDREADRREEAIIADLSAAGTVDSGESMSDTIKDEVQAEVKDKVKEEIKTEVKEEIKSEVKDDLFNKNLNDELKSTLFKEESFIEKLLAEEYFAEPEAEEEIGLIDRSAGEAAVLPEAKKYFAVLNEMKSDGKAAGLIKKAEMPEAANVVNSQLAERWGGSRTKKGLNATADTVDPEAKMQTKAESETASEQQDGGAVDYEKICRKVYSMVINGLNAELNGSGTIY